MSATKSAGRPRGPAAAGTRSAGCAVVITTPASISSPLASGRRSPGRRWCVIWATSAPVRISAPNERAGGGQRRRHPAHAAAREAPGARLPVHVADVVVQHHVGGAAGPRARPGADHPGHRQQAAHRVAGRSTGRGGRRCCRSAAGSRRPPPWCRACAGAAAAGSAATGPGGRREPSRGGISAEQRAEDRAPCSPGGLVGVVGGGVVGRERGDLAPGCRRVVAAAAGPAVRARARSRAPAGKRDSRGWPAAGPRTRPGGSSDTT